MVFAYATCKSGMFLLFGAFVGFLFSKTCLLLITVDQDLLGACGVRDRVENVAVNHTLPKLSNDSYGFKSRVQPHFLASELAVRRKLLVVALLTPQGRGLFKELFQDVVEIAQARLEIVQYANGAAFADDVIAIHALGTFGILEHVAYKRLDQYDFYLLLSDTTYVNGYALLRLLDTLSAGDKILFNFQSKTDQSCSFKSGLLISNKMLKSLLPRISMCNLKSSFKQYTIEQCLGSLKCTSSSAGSDMLSLKSDETVEEEDLSSVITVENVNSKQLLEEWRSKFNLAEIAMLQAEIDNLSEQLIEDYGEENMTVALPLGTAEPWRSSKRYDLLLWDYFDEENVYEVSNGWNYAPLNVGQRDEIGVVKQFAVEWLKTSGKVEHLEFSKLLSGYRRFDPIRGMEYVVDLQFASVKGHTHRRRVFLLRALSNIEILPVPFVAETASVSITLPVAEMDIDAAVVFLKEYKKKFLLAGETCKLYALLMLKQIDEQPKFGPIIEMLNSWRLQLRSVGLEYRINYMVLKVNSYSLVNVLDHMTSRMKQSELILLATPWLENREELLKMIRVNTIENFQVFFPVPFVRYHPTLISSTVANLKFSSDINQNSGQFDMLNFDVASFYSDDYKMARRQKGERTSLFDVFANFDNVHVLRAVDPSVRLRHAERNCSKRHSRPDDVERCLLQKRENLGSKAQLATFVFEHS